MNGITITGGPSESLFKYSLVLCFQMTRQNAIFSMRHRVYTDGDNL